MFSHSLKMRQYTYCRLPIVAPRFLAGPDRPHVCGYAPGDAASLDVALAAAQRFDRALIEPAARAVRSWTELAAELAGGFVGEPPADLADDVDST